MTSRLFRSSTRLICGRGRAKSDGSSSGRLRSTRFSLRLFFLEILTIAIILQSHFPYSNFEHYQFNRQLKLCMFTKIREVAQFNRLEFLRSFGYDCLDKIKSIETKFNQVEWDLEKYSFEVIAAKVKTMIDSYQIISHQIYDSCQSADVDTLGHSVVKMFLQISSAIKWLIQSFSQSYSKRVAHVEVKKQQILRENESQRFRKREISRFILKGVKQKLDSQANELYQSWDDDMSSLLGIDKQNYGLCKAKLHSINSSNLPIILEDTVDYFTKKGEYIEKFIALRQNYEGASRLDQVPTGQSIFDAEQLNRNNIAMDKFRQMLNKYQILTTTKQVNKVDFGMQVAPAVLACEKIKKAAEKTKLKQLSDDLQKQKTANKALKIQLEVYEKKLSSSLKQNQQFEIIKKTAKIAASQFYKKQNQYKQQKEISYSQSETSHILKLEGQKQLENGQAKIGRDRHYKRNSHVYKRKSIEIIRKSNSAQEIQKNTQSNEEYTNILAKYKLFPQAYSIMIQGSDRKINIKINQSVYSLDIYHRSSISRTTNRQLQICSELEEFEEAEKRFASGKLSSFGYDHNSGNSSRISFADEHFGVEKKSSQRAALIETNKIKTNTSNLPTNFYPASAESKHKRGIKLKLNSQDHQKRLSNFKLESKNFDTNCLLLKSKSNFTLKNQQNFKNNGDKQSVDFRLHFETLYRFSQISNAQVNQQTLSQFFVQENNAKNYELLNLSQMCSFRKISRPHRKTKASTQIKHTSGYQQQQYRFDNVAHNIIAKRIYLQLIKLKQRDKPLYLRVVLFIRYPYSSVYRTIASLYSKIDEGEEIAIQLPEIVTCFKRIWGLHHGCSASQNYEISIPWCSHKEYILKFFGIYFNMNLQCPNENVNPAQNDEIQQLHHGS